MTQIHEMDAESINEKAEELGEKYASRGISTNQIRRVYSSVRRAKAEFNSENQKGAKRTLTLVKPNLAYAASRDDSMQDFMDDVSGMIDDAVEDDESMENFFELMEAIVAYHSYYEETGGGYR
jgi:CRISPR type III-A-associated protein Csm2